MIGAGTELAIDRLSVRSADDRAVREAVQALRAAHRPAPAGRRWLIVRQMHLRGLPREMSRSVARAVTEQASRSVWGGAPGAIHAEAVWFHSLAELLARLSLDLAAGRRNRWFWQRWMPLFDLPPAPALARLWSENIAQVPTVIADLAASGDLPKVWRRLDAPAAHALIAALSMRTGLPLPLTCPLRPAGPLPQVALPASMPQRWQAALAGLPETDHRRWLAAVFTALELGALVSAEAAPVRIAAIGKALGTLPSPAEPSAAATSSARRGIEATATRQFMASPRPGPDAGAGSDLRFPASQDPVAARESGAPRQPLRPSPSIHAAPGFSRAFPRERVVNTPPETVEPMRRNGPRSEPGAVFDHHADGDQATPTAACAPAATRGDELETAFGGTFYLINLLNLPPLQTLLRASAGWGEPLAGWSWLARAALHLGLDPFDPLSAFLSARLEREDAVRLVRLPPLPRPLITAATASLGELWAPALIAVPALLRHTPSHIELHFPIAAVRLEVRLAGLDLNPGWVPWLGRVVTFHYDDAIASPTDA